MIVNAELYVKDLPGQLVGSLEPISIVDGNILGVVHNRERIVNHRICINITFEVEEDQLERLKGIWKSKDVIISKIGSAHETYTMDYMLIGDIDARYIERLINKASTIADLEAVDVRYSSKATDYSKRTGILSVKTKSKDDLDKLDEFLDMECRKSGMTYVRGV
ncbi:homoserine dehydrogenase [Candidatus Methanoprimaticola sp. MG2]|uniref:homoserine dehydrogenase n=1 Tax=Candidatus Methanoprimaticola sp. MG2 TaxID=3228838 RepID=UPI0039C66B1B